MKERIAPASATLIQFRPYQRVVERRVLALDCAVLFDDSAAQGVTIAAFADLTAAYLAEVAPELVVLPLFSVQQDATGKPLRSLNKHLQSGIGAIAGTCQKNAFAVNVKRLSQATCCDVQKILQGH